MQASKRLFRLLSRFSTSLLAMPRPIPMAYSLVVVLYAAVRGDER